MHSVRGLRRTRIVVVSDTHNGVVGDSFKLPKGDVLIHAGDLTNQGSYKELEKAVRWIEDAQFESKIVVAGNHDITLDSAFYQQFGPYFHNQDPQDVLKCQRLFQNNSSIVYLKNEEAIVNLEAPQGPRTTFKVFGSPMSPSQDMWAFGYSADEARNLWERIPLDTDILVTHTPPKYHLDERADRRSVGCEALRCALWRVRPRLAVCGHVHESRGAEIIRWDLGALNIKYKEAAVDTWTDPGKGNKKQSLLDLPSKSGKPLDNDGATGDEIIGSGPAVSNGARIPRHPSMDFGFSRADPLTGPSTLSVETKSSVQNGISRITERMVTIPAGPVHLATRGQGGTPPSRRCDLEALSGRMGRRETCIVNAAMIASSWPHKGSGGKRFNKPIVIDLDLPVNEN